MIHSSQIVYLSHSTKNNIPVKRNLTLANLNNIKQTHSLQNVLAQPNQTMLVNVKLGETRSFEY